MLSFIFANIKKIHPIKPLKKHIYTVIASAFVAIGTIGIFVPLLPTTPFLLLAVYFYMNSSRRHLKWLLKNRYLGMYIHNYTSKKGMPLWLKIRTISLLWITLIFGMIFATQNLHLRLFLAVVGIGVTIHIYVKKTSSSGTP